MLKLSHIKLNRIIEDNLIIEQYRIEPALYLKKYIIEYVSSTKVASSF